MRKLEGDVITFVFTLCIFINSGLVVDKALEEYTMLTKESPTPFAKLLQYSLSLGNLGNRSQLSVLSECAAKIKSRYLLSICIILSESDSLGNNIVDKLIGEINHLCAMDVSEAKSRAKRAESKLSFPLGLILIVLMIICIAPSFITMGG